MSDLAGDFICQGEFMTPHKNSKAYRLRQETIRETAARGEFSQRRRAAHISQVGMAKLAGVSSVTIANFEKNRPLRPITRAAVERAYGNIQDCSVLAQGIRNGELDSCWLKKQTESFLRANCLGVVEKEKMVHYILTPGRVYDFGRLVLLAAGKNID